MNERKETAIWGFWSTIRSLVAAEDYITAAVLVSEVKAALCDGGEPETAETV